MQLSAPARCFIVGILALPLLSTCDPLELCPIVDGRVGFFSKGDCVLTRATFFSGHEWITYFGNQALPADDRFTDEEIGVIIEGNRRTDFPLEMLVHLNTSVVAYSKAIIDYQDRPENQRTHFLLGPTNESREAAVDSYKRIERLTFDALNEITEDRIKALTKVGQTLHTIQDSFSSGHTIRACGPCRIASDGTSYMINADCPEDLDGGEDCACPFGTVCRPDDPKARWCLYDLKAYLKRDDLPPERFHGGRDESNIGHTTTADSIYRPGRACHDPKNAQEVEACLSDDAVRAVEGTQDYLDTFRGLLRTNADPPQVQASLDAFIDRQLSFCDTATTSNGG